MKKLSTTWMLAAAVSVTLLAGCGGGGGSETTVARGIDQNVSDLIAYMKGLIALDENSAVVDINPLTLAVDDMGDPAPL